MMTNQEMVNGIGRSDMSGNAEAWTPGYIQIDAESEWRENPFDDRGRIRFRDVEREADLAAVIANTIMGVLING